jgi:hypothetical protein
MIMRAPADYVALRDLKVPGSDYAYTARAGDEITEAARGNSGWVVGQDVRALRPDSMPRPDDADDRRAWQDYAVVRGVPYAEALTLDRADLMARVDSMGEEAPEAEPLAQPEDKASKAAWVDYAAALLETRNPAGATDDLRASLQDMTKAELVATFGEGYDPESAQVRKLAGLPEEVEVGPGGLVRPAGTGSPE